jgi:uncharacterized protein (DUF2147 family)
MRLAKSALVFLAVAILATPSFSASDDILGAWFNQDKDAKIEIFKCGNDYCGKIIWLKEPVYPAASKEGTPGTPKLDTKNPDAAHRKDPLMGLQMIYGFQPSGDGQWKNGKIYDPDSGKTYSAKATLVSHDQLDLRGFIGISLIGRTERWTRAS